MTARVPIQQDRTLFNAKFEGYKLSFLDESSQHFSPVGAPGPGVLVPKVPASAKLSYREVQSRIRHNHLYPGWNSLKPVNGDNSSRRHDGVLFVIDDDFTLIALHFEKPSRLLRSTKLLQVPKPIVPANSHHELPSIKPISPDYILLSDGAANFYLIRLNFTGTELKATIEATTAVLPEASLEYEGEHFACGLLEAKAYPITLEENEHALQVKFVVHFTHKETYYSTEPSPHHKSDKKTVFIVSLCSVILKQTAPVDEYTMEIDSQELSTTVIHSIRGTEIPFYCALDPSGEGYVIGSNTTFKPLVQEVAAQSTRFMEPGSEAVGLDGTDISAVPNSNPPYIWMQTESDVTVYFTLPQGTTKHAIQCTFSRQGVHLQVLLSGQVADETVRMPQLDNMGLFATIQADESFWTFEAKTGLLTLHLEKQHSKTRWTQVFAEGTDPEPVQETLDPSVLAEYKTSLEKYTTDQAHAGPKGSSLLPSLAQDAQEDIDEEGEEIKFSWIQAESGGDIVRASTIGTGHDWIGQAFPSFERQGENAFGMPTVCLKHDVDGLVYTIQHVPGSKPSTSTVERTSDIMRFIHKDTLDALAFVQASKREKRFVFHDPHGRFCVIVESSRNVYIYWHRPGEKQKQERQTVVDVSKGQQVDIIGCQLISEGVLVVLMEGQHGALVLELN
ncbi:hypothetical protein BGZ83_000964 [Gryganskiella cystojenkinii]|nr:hypothetical protein BGZ83_000964 [Gryganskiella cystojenkinii]